MGILGATGIKEAIARGDITIEPFAESSLQPNSYDVAIDEHFYQMDSDPANNGSIYVVSPRGVEMARPIWNGPFTFDHIGERMVMIQPGSMVLAATIEVIGAHRNYSTLLKTKSTIARLGIEVCPGAGFGDVGFVNKWTLEIRNNTNRIIALQKGTKVAQIAFFEVSGQGHTYEGNYLQREGNDRDSWRPRDMLPVVKDTIRVG